MNALSRTDFPTAVTKALKILKSGETYTQNKLAQKTDLNARTIQKVLSLLGEVQSALKEKEIDISESENVKIIRMKEKNGLASLPDSLQKMIIKTLYYPTASREEEILAHLLIKNAIGKKSAISLPEGKMLKELVKAEQISQTDSGKFYLTDIGIMVARGATELYSELKSMQ